jgi:hypothetical protein
VYTKAVKWRAKLSAAYLAEYEKGLAWAALSTPEKALSGIRASEVPAAPESFPRIWLR